MRSNLASTYNHWGLLASSKGDLELALAKLKLGVEMQNALMRNDPSNPQWIAFAAPNYELVARTLDELKRQNEAYRYLSKAYDLRKELTIRDPTNAPDEMRFAATAKALGDRSQGVPQIEAYRDWIQAWKRVADLKKPPQSTKAQADDALAIAKACADAKDWRDAQSAYWLAKRIADMNLADDPTSAVWKEKSDSAKQSAEDAAAAATAAARGRRVELSEDRAQGDDRNLNGSAGTNFADASPAMIGRPARSSLAGFAPSARLSLSRSTQKIVGL